MLFKRCLAIALCFFITATSFAGLECGGKSELTGAPKCNPGYIKAENLGKHTLNMNCKEGFFDPIYGGTCWSCDGWVRSATHIEESDACWQAAHEEYARAVWQKNAAFAWDCSSGTFWDGWDGGKCWKCPSDYPRRSVHHIADTKACIKDVAHQTKSARFIKNNGCPEHKGKPFLDAGTGNCYTCPTKDANANIILTERSAEHVDGDNACKIIFRWKPATYADPGIYGLTGAEGILTAMLEHPEVITTYLYQVAIQKGLSFSTGAADQYVKDTWASMSQNPGASEALKALLFINLVAAINKPAVERNSVGKHSCNQ